MVSRVKPAKIETSVFAGLNVAGACIIAATAAFVAITDAAIGTNNAVAGEPAVLTVMANGTEPAATLSMAELEAMPQTTISTSTIWTEGTHTLTGVALSDFLTSVNLSGASIQAVALNDYSVSIPVADAVEGGPIIAHRMDGEAMSVRDKGPLWIVYPYDSKREYRTEVIYSRSIWQLNQMRVED
ncbi:MAG: molybdopterin-dependent oxidoreductase [Pseudomonadota bacterium]